MKSKRTPKNLKYTDSNCNKGSRFGTQAGSRDYHFLNMDDTINPLQSKNFKREYKKASFLEKIILWYWNRFQKDKVNKLCLYIENDFQWEVAFVLSSTIDKNNKYRY